MRQTSVAILGAGSMGTAILAGLLKSGLDPATVTTTVAKVESADALAKKYGVTAYSTEYQPRANLLAATDAKLILLAVKPAKIADLLKEIHDSVSPDALVVSVAAGITTHTIESHLPKGVGVVRAMPNTPAIISKAVTGVAAGKSASAEQVAEAVKLFATVGKVVEIDESQIDALSTISGSGPAYVFFMIEAFTKAAIAQGFTAAQAKELVEQTFLGSTLLLEHTHGDPAELRRQVTSPNGTTMKAIAVLESNGLEKIFIEATSAALARAKEIAEGKI
jgi:pyrroline-5-carboxylate reductase